MVKAYKWVCGCEKNPLNNLFPNGEYSTVKPVIDFEGICKVCNQKAKIIECEI